MPTLLDTIAAALLTYGAHSFVACAIALIAARMIKRPQDRDVVWKATFVAPLLTAATTMLASAAGRRMGFVDLALIARRVVRTDLPGRRIMVRVFETPAGRDVTRQFIDPVTHALTATAIAAAALLIVLATIRCVHRRGALARALAPRRTVSCDIALSRGQPVKLSVADGLQSPIAFGAASVCVPSNVMSEFTVEHRDALLAHEVAHLERRDPSWLLVAELITALSAFQPLVFVAARAFRRDVELICDEAALHRTNDRRALLGALAHLAAPFDPQSSLSSAASAYNGSPLVARAARIASVELGERPRRGAVLLVVPTLAALLCAVPIVSPAPWLNDFPAGPLLDDMRRAPLDSDVLMIDSDATAHRTRKVLLLR